jgi:hypothetical protein
MYLETGDNLYITYKFSSRKDSTTTLCELHMLMVEVSMLSRAQPIMFLYGMSLGRTTNLCVYD